MAAPTAKFLQAGDVTKALFAEPYPVTKSVQVARLYRHDLMIEITAIAEIPRERFRRPAAKGVS